MGRDFTTFLYNEKHKFTRIHEVSLQSFLQWTL